MTKNSAMSLYVFNNYGFFCCHNSRFDHRSTFRNRGGPIEEHRPGKDRHSRERYETNKGKSGLSFCVFYLYYINIFFYVLFCIIYLMMDFHIET